VSTVSDEIITSTDPSEENLEWIKLENDSILTTGEQLDKISTYFIGFVTTAYTFYTGLLLFFKINIQLKFFLPTLLILLPFLFWIISIALNLLVFKPNLYRYYEESPDAIKGVYRQRNTKKYKYLIFGISFFIVGILCISLALFSGTTIPSETPEKIQLIVNESKIQYLEEIPIYFINNTHMTEQLQLVSKNEIAYRIKLKNGDIVEIPNEWVQIVIINSI